MADFEPPSFSLGLDDEDDEFETLVVDDSEPEYPDPYPKLKRLRRGITKAELNSTAVIDDEDFDLQEDRRTDQYLHTQHHAVCTSSNFPPNRLGDLGDLNSQPIKRNQHISNEQDSVSTSCNNKVFTKLIGGFHVIDSDSDFDDPAVSRKCNGSDSSSNLGKCDDIRQPVKLKQNVSNVLKDVPNAYHYFFHDDPRIQELVRSRLPNFLPLDNMLNIDLLQHSTSKIDYMGQFSFGGSSKQAARTNKNKKSSSSKKISRKSETEVSQGWVNPKLGVDKVTTKGTAKRKVHAGRQIAGHWLTGSDGKKVYVGKSGQELTGRAAYMQHKKESGLGYKKVKRKSFTKKKK